MGKRRRVLLYGDSLVLSGIGATVLANDRFEVVRLPQPPFQTSDFGVLDPDVIIFDTETPDSMAVFSALESRPDLILLGVSPDKNIVRLWSGRQYRELSTTELTALIEAGSRLMSFSDENVAIT